MDPYLNQVRINASLRSDARSAKCVAKRRLRRTTPQQTPSWSPVAGRPLAAVGRQRPQPPGITLVNMVFSWKSDILAYQGSDIRITKCIAKPCLLASSAQHLVRPQARHGRNTRCQRRCQAVLFCFECAAPSAAASTARPKHASPSALPSDASIQQTSAQSNGSSQVIMYQILNGMAYMHARSIMHR
eukprot:361744-Chlamydomonas_euryale.AAC.3